MVAGAREMDVGLDLLHRGLPRRLLEPLQLDDQRLGRPLDQHLGVATGLALAMGVKVDPIVFAEFFRAAMRLETGFEGLGLGRGVQTQ